MLNFKNYTITERLGKISKNQIGLFTPSHEKHGLSITILNNENGEKYTYRTSYQCNPRATAFFENDGLRAVLSDADAYASTRYFENFVSEFGYSDPLKAWNAFQGCKRAFDFFHKARIDESKIAILRDILD